MKEEQQQARLARTQMLRSGPKTRGGFRRHQVETLHIRLRTYLDAKKDYVLYVDPHKKRQKLLLVSSLQLWSSQRVLSLLGTLLETSKAWKKEDVSDTD
ncbi:hypothetical protein J6590_102845 [Homalodisca vitripennis]|nr:hypothetical protein J6590_102845 [Homalodisca vitripennis]